MTAEDIEMIQTAETIVCKGNGRVFVSVDKVLEIIDSYKYSLCWSISEKLWNENMDKIKAEVLGLKGM